MHIQQGTNQVSFGDDNMNYKWSMFNIKIERNNRRTLIANTFSNQKHWIDNADYEKINKTGMIQPSDIYFNLIKGGFVVPATIDEMDKFLTESVLSNYNPKTDIMSLVIAPTMSCNYRCSYCFEANRGNLCNSFMTDDIIDDIIKFLNNQYKIFSRTKTLQIKWFGGEPLLHIDMIEKIVKRIKMDFANENGIRLKQMIITNGKLLTLDVAKRLEALNIKKAQITIDGMPTTYAKMKGCQESDFYTVVENIKNCQDFLNPYIRVNIADYNKNEIKELIDYLDDNGVKVYVGFQYVRQYTDEYTDKTAVDTSSYLQIREELAAYIKKEKKNITTNIAPLNGCYGCEANRVAHWCIAPDGGLYRCEHVLAEETYKVGTLKEGLYKESLGSIWMNPLIEKKCTTCGMLPVCVGNNVICIADRDIEHIEPDCDFIKKDYIESTKFQIKATKNS